jgi:two-component system, sensor histidine kinase and response regulator
LKIELDIEQKKPLILVVDDIPDNLLIFGMALRKTGYNVSIESEPKKVLNRARELKPDIILLDILMPEMDGYLVCEQLKSDPETMDIPVIFLTARSNPEDVIKGFKTGASDYIIKPFSVQEAVARIVTHIELKRQRDLNFQYIDQLKLANQMLSQAEKELLELNASKDKFFSIISHDLRNPLQGFLGLTDLVVAEFEDFTPEDLKIAILEINNSAKRLNKLLENLLTWSRLQIGKIKFEPVKINLKILSDDVIKMFQDTASNKNIKITNKVSPDSSIFSDRFSVETIMRNLVSNAIKYSYYNGEVIILQNYTNGHVKIMVQDNGMGMTEDEISKILRIDTDFTRIGTNNETGTGLGLILCKDLAEKIGGKIEVSSSKEIGTTFSLILPVDLSPKKE